MNIITRSICSASILTSVAVCGIAAPLDVDASDILAAEQNAAYKVNTTLTFMWSPEAGFSRVEMSPDGQPIQFIGFAGTDLPGAAFRWHPEHGLVPLNFNPLTATPDEPVSWTSAGTNVRSVIWNPSDIDALSDVIGPVQDLTLTDLIDVTPNATVLGAAINSEGGKAFFTWSVDQGFSQLDTGPDATLTSVIALSDEGNVIGQTTNTDGENAAVMVSLEGMVTVLTAPDGSFATVEGLNNLGQSVGSSSAEPSTAIVWDAEGTPSSLADQLSSPLPDGVTLVTAHDINDSGQIVGSGITTDGDTVLLTLTPQESLNNTYAPTIVGETFAAGTSTADSQVSLSDTGAIVGECSAGSRDCPTGIFDFASLDAGITNQFVPNLQGGEFLRLVTGASLSTSNNASAPVANTSTPDNTVNQTSPFNDTRPDFGTANFPTLGTTTDTSTTLLVDAAIVPLPAAGWLLMFGIILFRGSNRLLRHM